MVAAITLTNGMRISGIDVYRRYFDFDEIFKIISEDADSYQVFLKGSFPQDIVSDLFGSYNPNGVLRKGAPITLLSEPLECINIEGKGWVFSVAGSAEFITVNLENLSAHLLSKYKRYMTGIEKGKNETSIFYQDWPKPEQMQEGLLQALRKLTEDGVRQFRPKSAVKLYFWGLLHIQAGLLPDIESEDFKQFQKELDNISSLSIQGLSHNKVIACTESVELPFYTKKGAQIGNVQDRMEIVELKNHTKEPIQIKLSGTVLTRTIPSGESVYALRKNEKYLSFLPRVALVRDTYLRMENGSLCTVFGNTTQFVSTKAAPPVCWAHSNEYGTFIIDSAGRLDEDISWADNIPEPPVVMVSAFGDYYCLLAEDGSTEGLPRRDAWKNIIDIYVGQNSAIAINDQRVPVMQTGMALDGIEAVFARSFNDHYICLGAGGTVYTDSRLRIADGVRAVSICPDGYLVSGTGGVSLYGFDNQVLKTWPEADANELEASDLIFVWFSASDGEARCQKI